ncbi:hypothetical protein YC2023_122714 [Brassica napus]
MNRNKRKKATTQGIRRVTSPAPLQASLSLFASMCVFLGRADCDNEEGEESGFCELDLKVLMEIILKKMVIKEMVKRSSLEMVNV